MTAKLSFLAISLALLGCATSNQKQSTIEKIQNDFAQQAEIRNSEIYSWNDKIEEFYSRADKELSSGVEYADSIISNDSLIGNRKIANLHTIVGETYYDYGQYDLALERFYATQALIRDNPRNKANKAGCYAKKKEYSKALTLLQEASAFNYDFNWYVGNLHEMKGDKELAVERYNYLYQKDTTVYSYCNERIQEIAQNAELFTELQFRNRRRRTLIILEGVNENSEDTEIGEMRLEIKE